MLSIVWRKRYYNQCKNAAILAEIVDCMRCRLERRGMFHFLCPPNPLLVLCMGRWPFANKPVSVPAVSLCLSLCLSVCLSVRPSVRTYVRPSVRPSICLPVCLPACLSDCLPACLSACLPSCLSACLTACLSACLHNIKTL